MNFRMKKLKNYDFLPNIEETRKRIVSEESAYQIASLLMGVLERGTAKNINYLDFQVLQEKLATNNNQDYVVPLVITLKSLFGFM